ncbi:MAG: glycosyltransferase [Alphaproteobacteria bacterium]|nr:glycosyltransferase [Alphaproteobacteria bacterium]
MTIAELIADRPDTTGYAVEEDFDPSLRIAVLIPCYNEELAIRQVIRDFRRALPRAAIYVYDNNSIDRTREVASKAGAVVRLEPLQGKGNVVRRMFADIEADIYVLVDGDDTYHAASAPMMIKALLDNQLDMVSGRRVSDIAAAYRPGHRFGNILLTSMVAAIFGKRFDDMLSGYRVFSRRFVKSFPALACGFEIETELTVHTLELRMPTLEVDTPYKDRPPGSTSKLRTYLDGWRILKTIIRLVKEERPLQFFGTFFAILTMFSLAISVPLFIVYAQTGLVPRLPTAVLATGSMLLGFLSLAAGVILDTVTLGRREAKRMRYLEIPAPTVATGPS